MAKDKFRLPRSSYEELCKIIKAYRTSGKPSSLEEISHLSGINKTAISGNNAFLSTLEIVEGGNIKAITPKGAALSQALEHQIPEEIIKGWRAIVEDSEFLTKMIQAIKIRNGMDSSNFQSHIAYSAGVPKSGPAMTGARTVIDILRASGLVMDEGDRIVPKEIVIESSLDAKGEDELLPIAEKERVRLKKLFLPPGKRQLVEVNLNIEVKIDTKPSDIEDLAEKLKNLIQTISSEID